MQSGGGLCSDLKSTPQLSEQLYRQTWEDRYHLETCLTACEREGKRERERERVSTCVCADCVPATAMGSFPLKHNMSECILSDSHPWIETSASTNIFVTQSRNIHSLQSI